MKKYVLLFSLFLFVNQFIFSTPDNPVVHKGEIDLTGIKWENNVIKLAGEWELYWNQLILPDSTGAQSNNDFVYAKVPASWSKVLLPDKTYCNTTGFGTYHLRIKVPNKNQIYGLKVHSIFTAYTLFVNGEQLVSMGTVGTGKSMSKPKFQTQEIPVFVGQLGSEPYQWIDVTIQVSNFHHRRAGIQQPIYFGTMEEVVDATSNTIILNLLLIGIILIIGLNHLMMYFLRRLDLSNLMFGLLCVIMILRNLSTDERLLMHLFPDFGWDALVRIDNFSGFATISLFAVYFYFAYKTEFPKFMFYIITGIGLIITLLVFTTSAWFYGQFRTLFELYILLGGLYITFGVLLRSAIRKRSGGVFSFFGMFFLYATAINDVLNSMGIIQTINVAPYGIVVFMMLQSYLLTRKSAVALAENTHLSQELMDEKLKLEQRIEERTHALSMQAEELERYRREQEQQNLINGTLNQINEIMHQNKENLKILADRILAALIKNSNSYVGAMYFMYKNEGEIKLQLIAGYGLENESELNLIEINEGLTGKCFSTGKELILDDLPERYFNVTSGLGSAKPRILILLPLINDEKVVGVVELAAFKPYENWQLEFLRKALVNIAAQLNLVKISSETTQLLENYKVYESELRRKESEFHELQQELASLREKTQTLN